MIIYNYFLLFQGLVIMKPALVFFVVFALIIFLTTAQIHDNPERLQEHRVKSKCHLLNEATSSVGRKELNPQEAGSYGTSGPEVRHHYYPCPETQHP
jgi:hypothetical protein